MKRMSTLPIKQRTIIARNAAVRTRAVELHTADSAHIVLGDVPAPGCDGVVGEDLDFHCRGSWVVRGVGVSGEMRREGVGRVGKAGASSLSNRQRIAPDTTMDVEDHVEEFNARPLSEIREFIPPLSPPHSTAHVLEFHTSHSLPSPLFEKCFALVEFTQRHMYASSPKGWRPKSKRKEMRHPAMRYLILTSLEGEFEGFLSCMITIEDDELVVYCYELHLMEAVRGMGLGKVLIGRMEEFGRKAGMRKGMLTVFMENVAARRFYERIGYERDEYTPEPRVLRNGVVKEVGYEIRSKEL